jgi:hypothetical protein
MAAKKSRGAKKSRAKASVKRVKNLRGRDVSSADQGKVRGGLMSAIRAGAASLSTGGASSTYYVPTSDGKPTGAQAYPSSGAATRA